ncbi:hypothetical protein [Staphylococcus phage vB_StaM_SA1]|nr:hypothetical protein [Staphylococcus phage vB_StaM_SA1]
MKKSEEVLKDLELKAGAKGNFEVIESDELGVEEAYDEEVIENLGLDVDENIYSYSVVNENDDSDLYTLEYDKNGTLLTIHDFDEEMMPLTIYTK